MKVSIIFKKNKNMKINATIEKIQYEPFLNENLQVFELEKFDMQTNDKKSFALSRR